MDWVQFCIFFVSVFGLFIWNRTEGRSDSRHLQAMIEAIHKEIYQEMKDFHGRLCSIEEKRKDK